MVKIFGALVLAFSVGPNPPAALVQRPDPMFPDWLEHNFGKVALGTLCKHTFRIVNTRAVPLSIVSIRST
jgi:hypothetical protein